MLTTAESLHGAIHERQHSLRIDRGAGATQQLIARDNDPGFRAYRSRSRRSRLHNCQRFCRAARAQERRAG
jgi:hypothetical protein